MFTEWFNRKYQEWRGNRYGQDSSAAAFARWLDLKQQAVDSYLRGTIPRNPRIINKLIDKYGVEVLEEIGMAISVQQQVIIELNRLPRAAFPRILNMIREVGAEYNAPKSADKDNPGQPDE